MAPRLLLALCFALVLGTASSSAQIGLTPVPEPARSGVRVGVGVGASVYNGPNVLYPLNRVEQENVTEVRPAVTGFIAFPLGSERLYGRGLAGVLNIGAEDEPSISRRGGNPFLTNEQLLLEGNLMLNLTSPSRSSALPYVFSGFGALIADPFGRDEIADELGRTQTAFFLPLGLGLDLRLSRNVGLFGEASYRLPLSRPGEFGSSSAVEGSTLGACEVDPRSVQCKKLCESTPSLPICSFLEEGDPFETSFGSGLLVAGLRLGFGRAPGRAVVPPPPVREVAVAPQPPAYIEPPEPARVCDLVELNQIYFDHSSTTLSSRAQQLLDENIALLLANPACCVFIDGYTDESEGEAFGMALAGQRAQAVYDYYLERDIAASRLQIRNRGTAIPACDKEDPGIGCSRNRRVESVPLDCARLEGMLSNPTDGF